MVKDTLEQATEPNLNLKAYLQDAYVHAVFEGGDLHRHLVIDEEENSPLVPTKRNSNRSSKFSSGRSSDVELWERRRNPLSAYCNLSLPINLRSLSSSHFRCTYRRSLFLFSFIYNTTEVQRTNLSCFEIWIIFHPVRTAFAFCCISIFLFFLFFPIDLHWILWNTIFVLSSKPSELYISWTVHLLLYAQMCRQSSRLQGKMAKRDSWSLAVPISYTPLLTQGSIFAQETGNCIIQLLLPAKLQLPFPPCAIIVPQNRTEKGQPHNILVINGNFTTHYSFAVGIKLVLIYPGRVPLRKQVIQPGSKNWAQLMSWMEVDENDISPLEIYSQIKKSFNLVYRPLLLLLLQPKCDWLSVEPLATLQ